MKVERRGPVVTAGFDSPPANAIGELDLVALEELVDTVSPPDSGVRVLVITGEGRFFAAGVDLNLVRANIARADGARLMAEFVQRLQKIYATIESLPIPTICAMNGSALGGGFELALACDLRIAAAEATYGLPEIKLGLLPGLGGTQRLTSIGGRALAMRMILSGESVTGVEAERLGLVQWSVPAVKVAAFAAELADELASRSSVALAAIKKCIDFGNSQGGYELEVETTRVLMDDPDARKGLRAFFSPDDKGKS